MCSILSFDYAKTHVDGLIALMSSTWDSMVAECVIRPPLSTTSLNIPKPTKAFVPLIERKRDALKQAGGCYRCQKTPVLPGWVKHGSFWRGQRQL